jgi:hypothetical protein
VLVDSLSSAERILMRSGRCEGRRAPGVDARACVRAPPFDLPPIA